MQHFDLHNRYSILITISRSLKILFRELRFHPSLPSSPFPFLSRLKTLEFRTELPAHFAFCAFEVLGPDTLDTAICLNTASSSSELITISPKPSVVRMMASTPSVSATSLLGWANPSPSTPYSSKRSCADSESRFSPSPLPVLILST